MKPKKTSLFVAVATLPPNHFAMVRTELLVSLRHSGKGDKEIRSTQQDLRYLWQANGMAEIMGKELGAS